MSRGGTKAEQGPPPAAVSPAASRVGNEGRQGCGRVTAPDHPGGAVMRSATARQLATMRDYLDELRPAAGCAFEALDRWHDVELTYTSLAIEGNLLTREETAAVLEHGLPIGGAKPLRDYQAAVGHMRALSHARALARDAAPIREVEVCRIHEFVLDGIDRAGAGRYSRRRRRLDCRPGSRCACRPL